MSDTLLAFLLFGGGSVCGGVAVWVFITVSLASVIRDRAEKDERRGG